MMQVHQELLQLGLQRGPSAATSPPRTDPDPASAAFDLQLEFWWEEKAAGGAELSRLRPRRAQSKADCQSLLK